MKLLINLTDFLKKTFFFFFLKKKNKESLGKYRWTYFDM